jgi:predicted HD superfamily hydrolase involved in NAD metabolism
MCEITEWLRPVDAFRLHSPRPSVVIKVGLLRRLGGAEGIMSAQLLDEIYLVLYRRLTPERVLHVLGTAHTAVALARRWEIDADAALLAALLHDMAKEDKPSALRRIMESAPEWSETDDEHYPAIWHAVAGAILAVRDYGVSESVARAILYHPTGAPDMDPLARVVFLADYIEPTRNWDGVENLRQLAMKDLEQAVRVAVVQKTDHVQSKSKPLHPRSLRTRTVAERS